MSYVYTESCLYAIHLEDEDVEVHPPVHQEGGGVEEEEAQQSVLLSRALQVVQQTAPAQQQVNHVGWWSNPHIHHLGGGCVAPAASVKFLLCDPTSSSLSGSACC